MSTKSAARQSCGRAPAAAALLALAALVLATGAGARPTGQAGDSSATRPDEDPMLALPSEQQAEQQVEYRLVSAIGREAPQHQQEQQYQYVQVQSPAQQEHSGPKQLLVYQHILDQQQQQQQQVHHHGDGRPCSLQHEQALEAPTTTSHSPAEQEYSLETAEQVAAGAPAAGRGYPGEIIYVNQNSASGDRGQLDSIAGSLAQEADMAATILTEIPVRDMPSEVLEKLKRDYGVKVVATRERPGANLVINCDDYTNLDNSVCARARHTHEASDIHEQQQRGERVIYVPASYATTGEQPAEQAPSRELQSASVYAQPGDEATTGPGYLVREHHQETHEKTRLEPHFEHHEIVYSAKMLESEPASLGEQAGAGASFDQRAEQQVRASQAAEAERDYGSRTASALAVTQPTSVAYEATESVEPDHAPLRTQVSPETPSTASYRAPESAHGVEPDQQAGFEEQEARASEHRPLVSDARS